MDNNISDYIVAIKEQRQQRVSIIETSILTKGMTVTDAISEFENVRGVLSEVEKYKIRRLIK